MFSYKHLLAVCFYSCSLMAGAQDSLGTSITYDLAAETAIGTGDFTAFQVVSNHYHALGTRQNTAYLRGAVNIAHQFNNDLKLSGTIDAIGSVHADHKAYLQQCFVNLAWKSFFIEAGTRENSPILRDAVLSSGAFIKGNNAKPLPQVHFGTDGFWTVPYTKGWVQINFDFGYGKLLDGRYHHDKFYEEPGANHFYADGVLFHQKHLYIRSNPEKPFYVTVGIEHFAQFGGTSYSYVDNQLKTVKKKSNLKAFWDVILPRGDSNYFENDASEDWVFGNHLGSMTVQLGWNIDNHHLLEAYLDNPFEDGSGIRKSNCWDGLWGLHYSNKSAGRQYVRGAVVEYLQTTNQCGPLHWDSGDYPEPIRSQITDYVTGNDNYYNHYFYDSYAHYGMVFGNPLITSPIYNRDGSTGFSDNRVKAWHVAVNGELTDRLSYVVKGSYREGWGTYYKPIYPKRHSFDALIQGCYDLRPWTFSAAYAFDSGNIYGNGSTFDFKISYHGKIL